MKRLLIALLALCLLLTLCVGCAKTPADDTSDAASEAVSDAESTDDATPGDESTEDAETESSEDGGLLLGTTTASDSATADSTTAGGDTNNTTKKNTTKKTDSVSHTLVTQKSTTAPTGVPTIATTTTKEEITLPKFDLDFTKTIKICIDWDPSSSWVRRWEQAFRVCYDPDKEIKIEYVQASPSMKASKLAVWKSAKQMPDAIYIKPEESWPTLINKGLAQSVDGLVDLNDGFWESAKGTMDGLKLNGKNYVLVSSAYGMGSVIYSPKLFKNAGLTDPRDLFYKGEWTFAKFEEYAKKLTRVNATDPSKSTYGCCFHYYEVFLFGGGFDLISYKDGKWVSNLNTKEISSSIEYLRLLGDTGNKYTYTEGGDMTAVRNMVISGQIGMFVTAESAGLEFTNGEFGDKETLRSIPVPHNTELSKTYYVPGVVDGWLILNGAKNAEGGAAYASAVRAMNVLNVDVSIEGYEDATSEVNDAQAYFNEYAGTQVVPVPAMFRRISSSVMYWDIYGDPVKEGAAWSAHVAEWEPKIMEALSKE